MPSTRRPRSSIDAAISSRRRIASVPGLTVSPHNFSLGNVARSKSRTRAPARARTEAAPEPAGPAPTIRTSFITARGAPHLLLRRGPTAGALGSTQSLALARPSTSLGATLSLSKGRRSDVHPSKDNRTVLRSEAEAIAQRGLDLDRTAAVGNEIEIARRVGVALVDRRREEPARHRQRGGDDACRPAGALRVPNHRLHRRSGQ